MVYRVNYFNCCVLIKEHDILSMYINQNDEGVSVSHSLIRRFSLFLPPNHPSQKRFSLMWKTQCCIKITMQDYHDQKHLLWLQFRLVSTEVILNEALVMLMTLPHPQFLMLLLLKLTKVVYDSVPGLSSSKEKVHLLCALGNYIDIVACFFMA